MGISAAHIFNSAVDQAQTSAKNLQAIRDARKKREQDDVMFDINKKKALLDLEERKVKGQGTSLQNQMLEMQLKEYQKQQQTINSGKDAMINQAEQEETQKGMMADQIARQTFASDPALQQELAMRLNSNRIRVPGPQGGMVEGTPEAVETPEAIASSYDNVPARVLEPTLAGGKPGFKEGKKEDFIMKRIKVLKSKGAPLLPQEEEALFKDKHPDYNRNMVLNRARQMARDDAESRGLKGANPNEIAAMIPEAEKALYGESIPRKQKAAPYKGTESDAVYRKEGMPGKTGAIKKIKVQSPDGQLFMLPEDQWDKAKAKGFQRAE